MSNRRTVPPTALAVSVADAKAHARIEVADDDVLIESLIQVATDLAETLTGRAIMPQTWETTLDSFPEAFELARIPVASVVAVFYVDEAGITQTVAPGAYTLDASEDVGPVYLVPAYGSEWPTTRDQINAVMVRYVCGYADAASVPEPVKQWIKIQVATMYDNRHAYGSARDAASVRLPFVDGLLDRFKVWAV